ncbi:MAG: ImmA/IrrE family metallo-endopeptidase [Polyangiales bacterium]
MISGPQIGELLSEAREAWALDAASLAARAGLDAETVDEALRGDVDVSDLDAIVRALGGTIDDLLAGRRFWVAPSVAFKSAPGEFESALVRSALLRVASAARDRAALTALLSLPDPPLRTASELSPIAPTEDVAGQAEELARAVRSHLGNERDPILSVRDAMRTLGVWTFVTDFGVSTVDGMLWRDAEGRSCAVANSQARGAKLSALRMTFAHELCHALFDGTRSEVYGLVESRSERGEIHERRANAFAAHLLAPRVSVLAFLRERGLSDAERPTAADVRALSDHFQMGVEAMAGHLVSCRRWERADMHRFRDLWTRDAIGPDNRECHPNDLEARVPLERRGEVMALATVALERGAISVGRWRELLDLDGSGDWRGLLDEGIDVEHRSAS